MVKKFISNLVNSNTFIVTNEFNEALIVDAGVNPNVFIKDLKGFNVVGILVTHCHFDHVAFLKEYIQVFNSSCYIGKNAEKEFNNPLLNLGSAFGVNIELPTSSINFLNEGVIKLGHFEIEVVFTPGHSIDSVCYKIKSMLFSGDTLFFDAIGRTDLAFGSVKDIKNSLEKLKQIKFDLCLSGHGKESNYFDQIENINYFIKLLTKDFIT